jgi:hypothetical protein
MCERESLRIYFLPAAPNLQYCIHNATSAYKAVLYFKHKERFIEWETGLRAYQFWEEVRKKDCIDVEDSLAIFRGAAGFVVTQDPFYRTLKNQLRKYFPSIADQVVGLCFDGKLP